MPYLVMELLRGEDLAQHIESQPRWLSIEEAVDTLIAVCAGVVAAHDAGILHRDLKPRNIFLARTSMGEVEAKVLDFGISKIEDGGVSAGLTDTGTVMGTAHYMSPEQVEGEVIDARADQYSLGVVLYECVTGRRPHEGASMYAVMRSIGEGKIIPPSGLRPELPAQLEAAILRAMSRNPADRFETVHAFGAALLAFASPRSRVLWSEYYRGVAGAVPLQVADAGHQRLPPTQRLESLPASGGAANEADARRGSASDRAGGNLPTTSSASAISFGTGVRSGSRGRPLIVAAAIIALAGAGFAAVKIAGSLGSKAEPGEPSAATSVPLEVRPAPPSPAPPPASREADRQTQPEPPNTEAPDPRQAPAREIAVSEPKPAKAEKPRRKKKLPAKGIGRDRRPDNSPPGQVEYIDGSPVIK